MTIRDVQLEEFYRNTVAKRPQRKNEETLTSFNRDIYWYDKDELRRQAVKATQVKINYSDHRKVIEIAVNMMRKNTQHDIAMCILTHRFFKEYRTTAFKGKGNFKEDYTFIIKKVGAIFNPSSGSVKRINITAKLNEFTIPTLVSVNHIVGQVTPIKIPNDKLTLNEWAIKYSENAVESTSYMVAGLKLG